LDDSAGWIGVKTNQNLWQTREITENEMLEEGRVWSWNSTVCPQLAFVELVGKLSNGGCFITGCGGA